VMAARNLDCEVVLTRSGARAMRDRVTGELMHPVVGPAVEAETLYVAPSRLQERLGIASALPLVLFDVGLGAGSNAVAAWSLSERMPSSARRLEIVSFDRSTDALRCAVAEEHAEAFGFDGPSGRVARTLQEERRHETARTLWRLVIGDLPSTLTLEPGASADVVFWDPFSPKANPSLWTAAAFATLRRACRAGATIHTYSGATATRSALLLGGFAVGAGCGTHDGKQTTAAAVSRLDLESPLDQRWLERLRRSSAPLPPDAPSDAFVRIASLAQFTHADRTSSVRGGPDSFRRV
jgi:queuine tRNA-ribosyltransferase